MTGIDCNNKECNNPLCVCDLCDCTEQNLCVCCSSTRDSVILGLP